MHLLYIFDRRVSTVVIDIGFQEISMKRDETSFFVVVAWIFCMSLCGSDVIDIGFQEISMKRLETSFFAVVGWIYSVYSIDESL